MKSKITLLTFLFLVFSLASTAQTIEVSDGVPGCITGISTPVVTFSIDGDDGGTPPRNIYTLTLVGPAGTVPYRIIWDNIDNQWELQMDFFDGSGTPGSSDGVYETDLYANSFASAPNPPTLGSGVWDDVPFSGSSAAIFGFSSCNDIGGDISQFDGDGTQSTLGAPQVPTLSEWGLIILALLLLNFGVLAILQHKVKFTDISS